jgi:hypothetical protein
LWLRVGGLRWSDPVPSSFPNLFHVTHYEVLGVEPDASADEIRTAYLALARLHHPDRFGAAEAPAGTDERMRDLNAAWRALSDPDRRARYDLEIGSSGAGGPRIHRLDDTFVPLDDSEDDDSWRYEPDVGDPRTAPGRVVSLLPLVLGLVAIGIGVAATLLREDRLFAVAGFFAVMCVVSFVVAPLVAMVRAAHYERPDE